MGVSGGDDGGDSSGDKACKDYSVLSADCSSLRQALIDDCCQSSKRDVDCELQCLPLCTSGEQTDLGI